jgi:hypothetical protein
MRLTGRALLVLDVLIVEALVFGLTIFLTYARSPERLVVWAAMVALPVLALGVARSRRA